MKARIIFLAYSLLLVAAVAAAALAPIPRG
jgi:hypothetical protein